MGLFKKKGSKAVGFVDYDFWASAVENVYGTRPDVEAFDKLVTIIFSTTNPQLIKQGTWALSNFFRIRPKPPFDAVSKCLNVIARAMNINVKKTKITICKYR